MVRYYLSHAKAAGAQLDVKLALPAKLGILDTDLTIVFGNLFENAAQAVASGKAPQRRWWENTKVRRAFRVRRTFTALR